MLQLSKYYPMSFFETEFKILNRQNKNRKKQIQSGLRETNEIVFILSKADLIQGMQNSLGGTISSVISNAHLIKLLISDFGLGSVQYYIKTTNSETYFVFKNYPGYRKFLTGTIYKENHFKMIELGLGQEGAKHIALKALKLNIIFSCAQTALSTIMSDERSAGLFFGAMSTTVIKTGLTVLITSKLMGVLAVGGATVVGSAATVGAAPVIIAFVIGATVSISLEIIDEKFGVTEALASRIDAALEYAKQKHDALLLEERRLYRKFEKEIGCGLVPRYCGFF